MCDKRFYCEYHKKEENIRNKTMVNTGDGIKFYCTEAIEELMDEGKIFLCPDCGQFFTRGLGTLVNEDMYEEKYVCNDCLYNGSYYYCEGLDKWNVRNVKNMLNNTLQLEMLDNYIEAMLLMRQY